jgi:hypothetical protein
MKPLVLASPIPVKYSRILLVLALLELLSIGSGCSMSAKPSDRIETLCRTLERGEVDRAACFFSNGLVNKLGIEALKEDLSRTTAELKEHGGIKSIKVLKEDVVGDVAEVTVEVTRGNGNVSPIHYKLIKEQEVWKVDGVSADSGQANEPLHPESAAEDVAKWGRDMGASQLKSWIEKQPSPAICKAPVVDRTTLPDEVKYHDVDDPKLRERLLGALDPVLKLVGCSNAQGVVLYKGQNVYAGHLDGGQIAVTPGGLYFGDSPPEEKIFHALAELRIFLAREIFRQMVPVEKSNPGFNEADMLLRRELKLTYLAGIASLTIDQDSTVFDGVALDLDLYGRPAGSMSGREGVPTLDQIKDIFGAAQQEYRK